MFKTIVICGYFIAFAFSLQAYGETCSLKEFSIRCPCPGIFTISCGNRSGYLYKGQINADSVNVQVTTTDGRADVYNVFLSPRNGVIPEGEDDLKKLLEEQYAPLKFARHKVEVVSAEFSKPPNIYDKYQFGELVASSQPGRFSCYGYPPGQPKIVIINTSSGEKRGVCTAARVSCGAEGKPTGEFDLACAPVSLTMCPSVNDCANDETVKVKEALIRLGEALGKPADVKAERTVK